MLVIAGALTAMMGRRYLENRAPLAGIISALSIVTVLVNAFYYATK